MVRSKRYKGKKRSLLSNKTLSMEPESFNQTNNQAERSKRTLIIVVLVLFLGGLVYFVSKNQPVNFRNKAANAGKLDPSQTSKVMLLGYSEMNASGNRLKVRVQVPRDFAFTPDSVTAGGSEQTGTAVPQKVSLTHDVYQCHDGMEDTDNLMNGYETAMFDNNSATDLDTDYYVLFTDQNGNAYGGTFKLEHSCTVLGKDAVQQVSPPATNDLPRE